VPLTYFADALHFVVVHKNLRENEKEKTRERNEAENNKFEVKLQAVTNSTQKVLLHEE
jgi:hypothetical protein